MKSEMLYDYWLRDGMINTDRQVHKTWRRMMEYTVIDDWGWWRVHFWWLSRQIGRWN